MMLLIRLFRLHRVDPDVLSDGEFVALEAAVQPKIGTIPLGNS